MLSSEIKAEAKQEPELIMPPEKLEQQPEFSQRLIDSSVDGILAFDREINYTVWNPAMERLTGLARSEVLGKKAFEVFPFLTETGEDTYFHEALAGNTFVVSNRPYYIPETGQRGFFEGHYSPLYSDTGEIIGGLAIIRDITERKQIEEERIQFLEEQAARVEAEAAQERQAFLAEASRQLASSLDYETVLATVARLAVPVMADWCFVDLIEEDGNRLRRVGVAHTDPTKEAILADLPRLYPHRIANNHPHPILEAIRQGKPQWFPEFTEEILAGMAYDQTYLEILKDLGASSSINLPLIAQGKVYGLIGLVYGHSGRHYQPSDVELAQDLARRVALAVENAQLYKKEQQARQLAEQIADHMLQLQQVTAALSQTITLLEVGQVIIEQSKLAMGAAAASLHQFLEKEAALKRLSITGANPNLGEQWQLIKLEQSGIPAVEVAKSGEPLWIEDVSKGEWTSRYAYLTDFQKNYNRQSYALLPVKLKERILGVLTLSFNEPRNFSPEEQALLMALAQQCAQALERARLYEGEQQARQLAEEAQKRAAFLAKAGEILSFSLDYTTTLARLARLTLPTLGDYCVIDLVDDHDAGETTDITFKRVVVAHVDPLKEQKMWEVQRRYPPDPKSGIGISRTLRTGKSEFTPFITPEMLTPFARNEEHLKLLLELAPVSGIAVPLLGRERTLGVLTLAFSDSGRHYTPTDLTFAEELARQASLAIENARLYLQAQQAIQVRNEFLSVAAHELKTPITSLKGYAQLINRQIAKGASLDPAQVGRSLSVINQQSGRLLQLVTQLLDISRLETGKLSLSLEPLDLSKLIQEVVTNIQLEMGSATAKYQFELNTPGPVEIIADSVRLEQVFTNLINNAVKYSPGGGLVKVEINLISQPAPGQSIAQVSVTDQGIGIAPEHRSRIFERFYQAHPQEHRSGLGLGLYISRQIVELHRGEIKAEFPPEGGSCFKVELPVQP